MKRILFISGSLGLGHITRDLAFANEIRRQLKDVEIHWLAAEPPLSVLAETGIFGFICFFGILYHTFRQLWEMRQSWRKREDRNDSLILCQGVLISLFCFMVNTSFSVKDHDPIYWAILTFASVLCVIYKNERDLAIKSPE